MSAFRRFFGPSRRGVALGLFGLLIEVGPARAHDHAEHQEAPAPPPKTKPTASQEAASASSRWHARFSGTFLAAWYDVPRASGSYQGLDLGAGVSFRALEFGASLPVYQLTRNDESFVGPGDPFLHARVRLLGSQAFSFGAALGASLPLGDATKDLGMGHVMLHAGLWARVTSEGMSCDVGAHYARALADDGAHGAHAGHTHAGHQASGAAADLPLGPLVNPMNASELVAQAACRTAVWRGLGLVSAAALALPVDSPGGAGRFVVSLGSVLRFGRWDARLLAHVPLLGESFGYEPFRAKVTLSAGVSW